MAYLTYDQYVGLGGCMTSGEFAAAEPWAEGVLDNWTLNRLHVVDWSRWDDRVRLVMVRLVDSREEILSGDSDEAVSHFANGVDTITFADPLANFALAGAHAYAADLLPVELCSRVVSYNGAN